MNLVLKSLAVVCGMAVLSGCVQPGTATQMATAMTAFGGVTSATQPASKEDYALSCPELSKRLQNLYARYSEVEAEQRVRQRQTAMVDGALGVGLGILGAKAATGAGSVSAIRNTQAVMSAGEGAIGLARAETSATDLKSVNDATIIAQRSAQLERLKFEKGCK